MPLSAAAPRKKLHTRNIELNGYLRDDGLFDIEGHMTDIKAYPIKNRWRNGIDPGEALHEMWVRLTINDEFKIIDVEAVTDNSPFEMCPNITENYKELIGLNIGVGWRRAVNEKVKGKKGCTHISELMGPLATVSFQTMMDNIQKKNISEAKKKQFKPMVLNSCHAWADDSEVVKMFFPEYYSGEK